MGILINTGFDLGSSSPIDSRTLKETTLERDALMYEGKVYENLKVYCKDTQTEYRWTGTEWEIVGSSGGDLTDYQEKTDNTLTTTDKTVTGAINEVNGNLLDTVGFSADYKNIILNRKNGLNPYTIPISAIINNASLAELKDIDSTDIGNGKTLVYDGATQKHKYVNTTGTDEFVKMDSTTDAKYLSDLIDKSTVVNDNGVLKVKKLDGQEVTITEINYLKGLTMNVMDLVNAFANGGVKVWETPVNTYSDLETLDRSAFTDGISYIVYVLIDETHSNAKTTYLCTKTSTTFFGNADSQRNFTTNPIDLANEVTGKLGTSNIDVDSLWTLLTINDTYKTLTTNNEVFGTHGAKAMYDELLTEIGEKANTSDIPTKVSELENDSNFVGLNDTQASNTTTYSSNKITDLITEATAEQITANSVGWVGKYMDSSLIPNMDLIKSTYFGNWLSSDETNMEDPNKTTLATIRTKHANCPTDTVEYIIFTTITDKRYGSDFSFNDIAEKKQIAMATWSDDIYVRSHNYNSPTWTKWRKVCTTSVEDVPNSELTNMNTRLIQLENTVNQIVKKDVPNTVIVSKNTKVKLNSNCYYTVINGVCYVSLWGFICAEAGKYEVNTSMPKTRLTMKGLCTYGSNGYEGGCAYVFYDGNGNNRLYVEAKTANEPLYGSFSYPVAE